MQVHCQKWKVGAKCIEITLKNPIFLEVPSNTL